MSRDTQKTSKFLSYILRHKPESIGLKLDMEGWASIDEILEKSDEGLSRDLIVEVVTTSDKKRFSLSADGNRIRANQGHSVRVDLGLQPVEPPEILFHGTAKRFVAAILDEGLKPGKRQHVHLSGDEETAIKVGQRHGKPVILTIPALAMHRAGHVFFLSDNGVWLTDKVPADQLALLESS